MLTLNKGYLLHEIGGSPYLLPYGQNIADYRRGIRLNESGLLLYRALEQGADNDILLKTLAEHYHAEDADLPALKEDISCFLSQLTSAGILSGNVRKTPVPADFFFSIGPAVVACRGPKELLFPSFWDFSCEKRLPDMTFRIIPSAPFIHATGEILIRTDELIISQNETSYLFLYPAGYGITETHVSLDGSQADFYCPKPYAKDLAEKLFHAFRFVYLIRAQILGAFAIHSASILYRKAAWLFSAPSGTGKSTHAALWRRLYQTPYLNGDLNLLGIKDGVPVVYGIPWCGTSGLYTTETVPLGGIVFLKQAPRDALMPLTAENAALRAMQRLISPTWTADMLLMNLSFIDRLSKMIPFFHLHCTREESAAVIMKEAIDKSCTEKEPAHQ